MAGAWLARFRTMRFQILFGLLLLTIVASPLMRALGLEGRILDAFLLASLLAAGLGGLGLGRGRAIVVLALLFVGARAIQSIYAATPSSPRATSS